LPAWKIAQNALSTAFSVGLPEVLPRRAAGWFSMQDSARGCMLGT
jgi:hypothetical protein